MPRKGQENAHVVSRSANAASAPSKPKLERKRTLTLRQRLKVARPEGVEPPTLCLEEAQYKTLSAADGVAYKQTRHLSRPLNRTEVGLKFWVNQSLKL